MKTILRLLLLSATLALAQPAQAGRDEAIRNPSGIPIAWNKERKPTIDEIGRAIVTGCAKRGWQCRVTRPGEIQAVLYVRQHMAESRITYDTQSFAISYVNSTELRYDVAKNRIHRKYNVWVTNLISDINGSITSIQ